jgi:hypothetical protein
MLDSSADEYVTQMELVEKELSSQKNEVEFMTNYFYKQWFDENISRGPDCLGLLRKIFQKKVDPSTSFPIITFNVEGKQISILRSTLLHLIGIKVSSFHALFVESKSLVDGRSSQKKWMIRELIVNNCSKKAFDQIITALQFYDHGPVEIIRTLCFTEHTKNEIEPVLDYLQIQFFQALCFES